MPLDRSRRSFIANGALTSAIVLAGQALTGWGKDEDRHRSDDGGFDAHVVKAVDVAKLLADVGAARQGLRC